MRSPELMRRPDELTIAQGQSMPTALVIDDTKFSRGRVVTALKSLSLDIVEAEDGVAGLEQFERRDPDVVITDLLMPRMNGLEFLAELRSRGHQTPVIVVSADIQESSRAACQALGIHAFINKPFTPPALCAAVDAALANASATAH